MVLEEILDNNWSTIGLVTSRQVVEGLRSRHSFVRREIWDLVFTAQARQPGLGVYRDYVYRSVYRCQREQSFTFLENKTPDGELGSCWLVMRSVCRGKEFTS